MIEFLLVLMCVVLALFGSCTYLYLSNRTLSKENEQLAYALVQQDKVREITEELINEQEEQLDEINDSIATRNFFD